MTFVNRTDAGRRLAEALSGYREQRPVVLALPRGGAPVAAEIAARLDAPLDLILVRKIGAPMQPELAMGAVVDGAEPIVVRNEEVIRFAGVTASQFEAARQAELAEIERRRVRYLGARARAEIEGSTAIVVDDGVATGATVKAALRAIRKRRPKQLVLAIPVAPAELIDELRREVDVLVCLETPEPFMSVGSCFDDFRQVTDKQVIAILARFPAGSGS
jgi:putative phosphoribosyl transferase